MGITYEDKNLIISKKQPISNPIKTAIWSLTKISQYDLLNENRNPGTKENPQWMAIS
jgi:hypothetical protein